MKRLTALVTTFTLFAATQTFAATEITARQAANLASGEFAVVTVDHNVTSVSEALPEIRQMADARGARHFQIIKMYEPEGNGLLHVSAALYRN
ncbi:DUF1471 domain-containing protein [Enterobacillus tribolii]|uniref:Uncharacterized protein DUF1471 n=1 Tax=Enterobacillus tribolii TaxID=1487935 RepID=A0A370R135_9GAMM|nr:DUF1471 domain-containing protein [Enterobacillus tribolii]MBW7982820.1 DUF1471 domain-containing protein [Enterobacillus tribolii]RDK95619.1 uncharacterized protein DUF1471 [Enterobacillus tribolii]